MAIYYLHEEDVPYFPPVNMWDASSDIIALGGKISAAWLLEAYNLGLFPWYEPDEEIAWWSPCKRFVLPPGQIKIARSMRPILRSGKFTVTFDTAFEQVITGCRHMKREGQGGTWIDQAFIDSYLTLHEAGIVHSAEAWQDGKLVGGLFGMAIGKIFFGDSMFSTVPNASKAAFIHLCKNLQKHNFELVDCQYRSYHLESLGASHISRKAFLQALAINQGLPHDAGSWAHKFKPYPFAEVGF